MILVPSRFSSWSFASELRCGRPLSPIEVPPRLKYPKLAHFFEMNQPGIRDRRAVEDQPLRPVQNLQVCQAGVAYLGLSQGDAGEGRQSLRVLGARHDWLRGLIAAVLQAGQAFQVGQAVIGNARGRQFQHEQVLQTAQVFEARVADVPCDRGRACAAPPCP